MPAKSDPEYFKLVNMNAGIGNYWEVPNNSPTGKFDFMSEAGKLSQFIINKSDPRLPDMKEELVENHSDDEQGSFENSMDLDVDMLIANVREKLKMGNKFAQQSTQFWPEDNNVDCGISMGGVPEPSYENCENSSSISIPIPLNHTGDTYSGRRRSNSGVFSSNIRRKHAGSQSHNSQSQQPLGHFSKQIINGGIQKSHRSNSCTALWTTKLNISKKKFPHSYDLLQDLLDSGNLINEAVRRIKKNPAIFTPITSNGGATAKNPLTQNCNFRTDEPELSFSTIPIGSSLTRNIIC